MTTAAEIVHFAWPGGYPVASYVAERDQLMGDVLCAACAKQAYATEPGLTLVAEVEAEREQGVWCGECGGLILGPFCQVCGDTAWEDAVEAKRRPDFGFWCPVCAATGRR